MTVTVLNIYCEAVVTSDTFESDARWQPLAVEFWTRLMDSVSIDSHLRIGYSRRVTEERTREWALARLGVLL